MAYLHIIFIWMIHFFFTIAVHTGRQRDTVDRCYWGASGWEPCLGSPSCDPGGQRWEESVQRVLSLEVQTHRVSSFFISQRSHMARNNSKDWASEIISCARRIFRNILVDKNYSNTGDFPGGPEVKNPPSNAGDTSSVPGRGTKVSHAEGQLSPGATTTEPSCLEKPVHKKEEPACHN